MVNMQLFIYIAVTLMSSWGISAIGFLVGVTVYYATQSEKLTASTVKIVILYFSVILFAVHMRANEVQMRAFLRVRDERSVLSKLVSILKCLPDGILIADMKESLYYNKKIKHLLQIYEEEDEINSTKKFGRSQIPKRI